MRGFMITLDAVTALTFMLFAMFIIAGQSYQPRAPGSIYLKQLTMDTITVLEKTGGINQALGGSNQSISALVGATPDLACMNVTIMDNTGATVLSIAKSGCNSTGALDVEATSRPVLYNGGSYIIRTESWFKNETG